MTRRKKTFFNEAATNIMGYTSSCNPQQQETGIAKTEKKRGVLMSSASFYMPMMNAGRNNNIEKKKKRGLKERKK